MKKYKLVNGEGYSAYIQGNIYDENGLMSYTSVHKLVERYPNDWEEVVEEVELPKKFKFKGDFRTIDDGSYGGLVVGGVYSLTDRCPDFHSDNEEYGFVKYYVEMYPNDWEEVVEESCVKIFTDAEVVTLITFLNDNFEGFKLCIDSPLPYGIGLGNYILLRGYNAKSRTANLIDKIEKNDTPLTEAEKVTLITFLNDRFEDFKLFTEEFLDYEFYEELDFDGDGVVCPLIDKIERS